MEVVPIGKLGVGSFPLVFPLPETAVHFRHSTSFHSGFCSALNKSRNGAQRNDGRTVFFAMNTLNFASLSASFKHWGNHSAHNGNDQAGANQNRRVVTILTTQQLAAAARQRDQFIPSQPGPNGTITYGNHAHKAEKINQTVQPAETPQTNVVVPLNSQINAFNTKMVGLLQEIGIGQTGETDWEMTLTFAENADGNIVVFSTELDGDKNQQLTALINDDAELIEQIRSLSMALKEAETPSEPHSVTQSEPQPEGCAKDSQPSGHGSDGQLFSMMLDKGWLGGNKPGLIIVNSEPLEKVKDALIYEPGNMYQNKDGSTFIIPPEVPDIEALQKSIEYMRSGGPTQFRLPEQDSNHVNPYAWALGIETTGKTGREAAAMFHDNDTVAMLHVQMQTNRAKIDETITRILTSGGIVLDKNETLHLRVNQKGEITIGNETGVDKRAIEKLLNEDATLGFDLLYSYAEQIKVGKKFTNAMQYIFADTILQREYGVSLNNFQLSEKTAGDFGQFGHRIIPKGNDFDSPLFGNHELWDTLYREERLTYEMIYSALANFGGGSSGFEISFAYKEGITTNTTPYHIPMPPVWS